MYIDADSIIKAASLVSALCVLGGVAVTVFKLYQTNKKQSEVIDTILEEQTLICYGMRGALQGIVELGGNGPVKDALDKLDKHLNKASHKPEF